MRRINPTAIATLAGVLLLTGTAVLANMGAGGFTADWYSIDGGGGSAAGGGLALTTTIGQHDAGEMTGGDWTLRGGFWDAPGAVTPDDPADLDGDGSVGFSDLLILLASWGTCPSPPDPCVADINDDGSVGFGDLLILLAAWDG